MLPTYGRARREEHQNETEKKFCGNLECDSCRAWRLASKGYRRQNNLDAQIHLRKDEPECTSCTSFFRKGHWKDNTSWVLHKSFVDLEAAASWTCRSCRLIRQAIVFDCPSLEDLRVLRSRRRPVWVLGKEDQDILTVEYGMWPRNLTLDLAKTYTATPQPNFDIESVLESAVAMLAVCTSNDSHTACSGSWDEEQILPTRVIDVGNDKTLPSLFITEGHAGRYCTLSYCWGEGSGWYNTTNNNMLERTRKIPFVSDGKSIPKTYHDAIIITRRLGIRYIWIDALCIIQDDKEDWQRESAKMEEIYQRSFCTIAATGATDIDDGILNPRPAQQMSLETIDFKDGKPLKTYFNQHIIAPTPDKKRLISDSRLNTRGWVLQEMLLSPRILHFTAHCLYFECFKGTTNEIDINDDIDNEYQPSEVRIRHLKEALFYSEDIHPSLAHKLWLDNIYQYTRKDLTEDGDRFPAISGVAARISHIINDRYVAGLWRDHMLDGLQWVVHTNSPQTSTPTRRPKGYVAPSWSWASVVGTLSNAKDAMGKWETRWNLETWESALDIVNVEIDLVNIDNPFGQVKSGFLRVRARLRPAFLSAETTSDINQDGLILSHDKHEEPFRRENPNAIRFDVLEEYAERSSRENLWCMEVYRCIKSDPIPDGIGSDFFERNHLSPHFFDRTLFQALVLKPTGVENQFRRVGFAKLTTRSYFDGYEGTMIEIV